ncbi:uncharacterized protein At2g34160-like [Impatiens glandulifera]|uniref:uncharacterized protein At2g34160-like n=1 Tax=Impatiens glandulifera TaxID=253017 RepID=UPI001FB144F6|nr:uncharacterized protein At2g34160-like [Impatiens glandulifera]
MASEQAMRPQEVSSESESLQQQKKVSGSTSSRIQVSNTKKPLFFYVNLAKRYIQQHGHVELSALGTAITTVVTIAEILKNNGLATTKEVLTSTVGVKDENKGGRLVQKARIEVVLVKTEKFDSLVTASSTNSAPTSTSQEISNDNHKDKEGNESKE